MARAIDIATVGMPYFIHSLNEMSSPLPGLSTNGTESVGSDVLYATIVTEAQNGVSVIGVNITETIAR